jgi:hypothetical protein
MLRTLCNSPISTKNAHNWHLIHNNIFKYIKILHLADLTGPSSKITVINPPKTKIKYSSEGPKPGHLSLNGFFGYKCQSKTRVTKFELIVAQ